MIINAWNVGELDKMALTPCHCLFQFYVADGKLSCQLYQGLLMFLGVPFNIASYALLTVMIAHVAELEPGEFIHTFGDVHLYNNHIEQANIQLARTPDILPTMKIKRKVNSILILLLKTSSFLITTLSHILKRKFPYRWKKMVAIRFGNGVGILPFMGSTSYTAWLMTMVLSPLFLSIFVVAKIAEWLEKSNVDRSFLHLWFCLESYL